MSTDITYSHQETSLNLFSAY